MMNEILRRTSAARRVTIPKFPARFDAQGYSQSREQRFLSMHQSLSPALRRIAAPAVERALVRAGFVVVVFVVP